jgi:uncharacterized membrane protein
MKAFIGKFFWGLVSNSEDQVSTGSVCATLLVLTWVGMFVWAQIHDRSLRVTPSELAILAGALYAIPKVRK